MSRCIPVLALMHRICRLLLHSVRIDGVPCSRSHHLQFGEEVRASREADEDMFRAKKKERTRSLCNPPATQRPSPCASVHLACKLRLPYACIAGPARRDCSVPAGIYGCTSGLLSAACLLGYIMSSCLFGTRHGREGYVHIYTCIRNPSCEHLHCRHE